MYVLSVGAGKEQLSSIIYAKELNMKVLAVDSNSNSPGKDIADIFCLIDIKNEEQVIEAARKHNVKYVLPSPIGRYLTTVGAVNDALNLAGPSKQAIEMFVLKHRFSEHLKKNHFFTAKGVTVPYKERSNLAHEVLKVGFPCIVKPSEGSGSRGVYVIRNKREIDKRLANHVSDLKHNENSIVEEFLEGPEVGIDGYIINSNFISLAIRDKQLTKTPYRQETGYLYPSIIADEIKKEIEEVVSRLVKTIDIQSSFFHADVICSKSGVFIVEATLRPPGLKVTEDMYDHIFKTNPLQQYISSNIREAESKILSSVKLHGCLGMFFFDLPKGRIRSIPDEALLYKQYPKLQVYENNMRIGQLITETRNGSELVPRGYFVIQGDNREEVIKSKQEILSQFLIEEKI